SLSQLVVSLAIAQGSRLPVSLAICSGNTFDGDTLKHSFESINKIAPPGPIELIMDRIFPTPSNISYLNEQRKIRECNWVSPLKIGLSEKAFRELVEKAYENNSWEQLDYRAAKDIKAEKEPKLKAFETSWTLKQKIVPDLSEGESRRSKGSIKIVEIVARCVVYHDEEKAILEKATRKRNLEKLEKELEAFNGKLNKYNYKTIAGSTKGLENLLGKHSKYKKFLEITLIENDNKSVCLKWNRNEALIREEEEKFDGIFALLTNYEKEKASANKLIEKYRERNEVEMNFRDLKGILDLERVFVQKQERIDCYIFLKSLAYFVLTFLRWYAEEQKFTKTSERNIQETLGEMCIVENKIMPIELKIYSVGNTSELSEWVKETFELNDPLKEIEELNAIELAKVDKQIERWIEAQNDIKNVDNEENRLL
ncbi:MAG TPA: transposase, partial [Candidatus Paceibacterota bacterium]